MTTKSKQRHQYIADDDEFETYSSIGVDGLLAASEKLLAVNRGLAETDDRDSLPNDRIYMVDQLMSERVKLDHGKVLRKMMGRVARAKNLNPMGPDTFGEYTTGYITSNPLVPALEEINPMHILEQQRRITKMGPGGIGDPNAITGDMQAVSASQFGFIDTIAGPECLTGESEVFTERGWVPWCDVEDSEVFACGSSDKIEWHRAERVVREHYTGELLVVENSEVRMAVTPNHRVIGNLYRNDGEELVLAASKLYGLPVWLPRLSGVSHVGVSGDDWHTEHHDGLVYCASVPGGRLVVRDSCESACYWTGNSEKAGIDVRLAYGTRIGSDGKIYQLLLDRRTGKKSWVSPTDLQGKTLKLPD